MKCKKCGNLINSESLFCPICGEKVENINNNKQSQKNYNKKIFLIIIIIGIILIGICSVFTIKNFLNKNTNIESNQNNDSNNNMDDSENISEIEETYNLFNPKDVKIVSGTNEELTKNIEIHEMFFNKYNTMHEAKVYGKNNNTQIVEVNLSIEYYDSEGYRIEKRNSNIIVYGNQEFVADIGIEEDSINYTSTKLTYQATKIKSYQTEIKADKIKYDVQKLEDTIDITIKNNSNMLISFGELACLYYKEGKIVYAENTTITGLEPNNATEAKFYDHKLYLNDNYDDTNKIEYDDYKIILISAYNYDSTNY